MGLCSEDAKTQRTSDEKETSTSTATQARAGSKGGMCSEQVHSTCARGKAAASWTTSSTAPRWVLGSTSASGASVVRVGAGAVAVRWSPTMTTSEARRRQCWNRRHTTEPMRRSVPQRSRARTVASSGVAAENISGISGATCVARVWRRLEVREGHSVGIPLVPAAALGRTTPATKREMITWQIPSVATGQARAEHACCEGATTELKSSQTLTRTVLWRRWVPGRTTNLCVEDEGFLQLELVGLEAELAARRARVVVARSDPALETLNVNLRGARGHDTRSTPRVATRSHEATDSTTRTWDSDPSHWQGRMSWPPKPWQMRHIDEVVPSDSVAAR